MGLARAPDVDPLPDINPRLASNGKGQFALVGKATREEQQHLPQDVRRPALVE